MNMRKNLRKIIALALSLVMIVGFGMPAFAANENNTDGVTFSVALDTPTIATSDLDQTVRMTLSASQSIDLSALGLSVTCADPLIWTSAAGGDNQINITESHYNPASALLGWDRMGSGNATGVSDLLVLTFTIPANTPAGEYSLGVTDIEIAQGDEAASWETSAFASTTLTIVDEARPEGYSSKVNSLTKEVVLGEQISVNLGVYHDQDSVFAAGELVVYYNATALKFNEDASKLGTATVYDDGNYLYLADYGADKNFGGDVYMLVFDTLEVYTSAVVQLSSAGFVNKENAVRSDLITATLTESSIYFDITEKRHSITLPDIFEGYPTVADGEDYTFSIADEYYDYEDITATVDGEEVTVIDNGDGTYTIENVTGELVITGTRTPMTFTVTYEGNAAEDFVNATDTATYKTDYTFTLPNELGWVYSVDYIYIDNSSYTDYTVADGRYTIPGADIKGDIVISVSKTETYSGVTVEGTGAGAAAGYDAEARMGESYILTLNPEVGYDYTVTAVMNGLPAELEVSGNEYKIETVTGPIVFTVNRTVIVEGVTVSEYLTLNGTKMWLVKQDVDLESDYRTASYNGEKMFWSDSYGTYCFLVIADTLSLEDAKAQVGILDEAPGTLYNDCDVNWTGNVDASDAQLVYNMYNAMYDAFTDDASMEKFLSADVNKDEKVDVSDATFIINDILN